MATNFSLLPSNHPANNVIKFSGVPLINFTLAANSSAVLQGSSVRLCGKFTAKTSAGGVIPSGTANLDERLGIYSLFDRLSISLLNNSQIIEEIKYYSRFLSSFTGVTQSSNQLLSSSNVQYGSTIAQGSASDFVVSGTAAGESEQFFSISLPCGLFQSANPINLQHGLVISVSLVPDAQAFRADGGTAPTYELSDIHLSGTMVTGLQTIPRELSYNSITSYYSVINSAFATLNFNLGTSNTIGAWVTFIPAENTNNYQKSGTRCLPIMKSALEPCVISDLQFLMNGSKVALEYPIEDNNNPEGHTLFNSQIMRNFMSAIKNFSSLTNSDVGPINTNLTQGYADKLDKEKGDFITGVGIKLDNYSDQGINMSSGNFTVQFTSDLDTDFPNSAYMFVHSRNRVEFTDAGIQVLN